MSPEPAPPEWFGRTPLQAARAALLLALLGVGAIAVVARYLFRPTSPLGAAAAAAGLSPALLLGIGGAAVLALAAAGYVRAVRTAEQFRITPAGFAVRGRLGEYVIRWENVERAEATPTGALGFRVKDREAVLATHAGTPQQRAWLETMAPFAAWDFLFFQAELGHSPAIVVKWMRPYLRG